MDDGFFITSTSMNFFQYFVNCRFLIHKRSSKPKFKKRIFKWKSKVDWKFSRRKLHFCATKFHLSAFSPSDLKNYRVECRLHRHMENEVSPACEFIPIVHLPFPDLVLIFVQRVICYLFGLFPSDFAQNGHFSSNAEAISCTCDYLTCHVLFSQFQSNYEYVTLMETVSK